MLSYWLILMGSMHAVPLADVGGIHAVPLAYVSGIHAVPLADFGGIHAVHWVMLVGPLCSPTGYVGWASM